MDLFSAYEVEEWLESLASSQAMTSWHKGENLRRAVSSFHEQFAKVPTRLNKARPIHTALIDQLFIDLRARDIPAHPEYVGSAYEGVKVAKTVDDDDLEFDVLVTIEVPIVWTVYTGVVPNIAGHVFLYLSESYIYSPGQKKTFFDSILTPGSVNNFIDGKKTIDKFFGELRNWIDASPDRKERILLRRHGPAVQIDVYEQKINSDRPYYTVDVVPALVIKTPEDKLAYVAKPIKSRVMPDPFAWRPLSSTEVGFSGRYFDGRIDRFTPTHLKYMSEIEKNLRYRLRFAGHKISSNDNNLEFKVVFIDDSKLSLIKALQIADRPEFLRLNVGSGQTKERLNSRKETTSFENALRQSVMNSSLLNGRVHIRRDGTTVRMIVCDILEQPYTCTVEAKTNAPLYCVDMMLAFEGGESLYVARPKDDWEANEMESSRAWRLSFSTKEKAAIYGPLNGCLKMVFRVLKVLRNREVALAPLTSYHLKTVMLHLQRSLDPSEWSERYLGVRLMDALLWLEKCLKEKNLPHFYLPGVNLTSNMVEDCIDSMGCRIHALCTKENKMLRVLHASN